MAGYKIEQKVKGHKGGHFGVVNGMDLGAIEMMAQQAQATLAKFGQQSRILGSQHENLIAETFSKYDKSGDGMVTIDEFKRSVQGCSFIEWNASLFPKVFETIDYSDDGMMTTDEMREAFQILDGANVFSAMDRDNTGLLNKDEWRTATMRINKDWDDNDAIAVFKAYDVTGEGVLSFAEFIDACRQMYKMFKLHSVQERIDRVTKEISWWEKKVEKLLEGVDFHKNALANAQDRFGNANAKHAGLAGNAKESKGNHARNMARFNDVSSKMDLKGKDLQEQKVMFREYKNDLRAAYKSKQWSTCRDLSDQLYALKASIDQAEEEHALHRAEHAKLQTEIADVDVDHAKADIDLGHLGELLAEAQAHQDEIGAAHGGHMAELAEADTRFKGLKKQLMYLEYEGAEAEVSLVIQQLDKVLTNCETHNKAIQEQCDRFQSHFKHKRHREIGVVGRELIGLQKKLDAEMVRRDDLIDSTDKERVKLAKVLSSRIFNS